MAPATFSNVRGSRAGICHRRRCCCWWLAKVTASKTRWFFPGNSQDYRQGGYVEQRAFRGNFALPAAPAVSSAANVANSRAFYADSSGADKVLIDVTVPADAKITFQGANTTQTGGVRRFVSPSIAPGYKYAYNIQATWLEHGRQVSQSRSFTVEPPGMLSISHSHTTR